MQYKNLEKGVVTSDLSKITEYLRNVALTAIIEGWDWREREKTRKECYSDHCYVSHYITRG